MEWQVTGAAGWQGLRYSRKGFGPCRRSAAGKAVKAPRKIRVEADEEEEGRGMKGSRRGQIPIKVCDFFSGCGGTSAGMKAAGMEIVLGIDNDPDARRTFERNFSEARFMLKDIRRIRTRDIAEYARARGHCLRLFCCCAPCQSFSYLNRSRDTDDERAQLLFEFSRFVRYYLPEFIFLENVPGAQVVSNDQSPFGYFEQALTKLGYFVDHGVVESQKYGVPQCRRRLVLVASLLAEVEMPAATHGPNTANPSYSTVWEWIGDLPPIPAGGTHSVIANHQAANLSGTNLMRIMGTPEGGGRLDWPEDLVLRCHRDNYGGHSDVYGRMRKDQPSAALTTRCTSLSNGRFGHPVQDRAISAREAASLQTFPRTFVFEGTLTSVSRQVGNAVPVLLAKRFGEIFVQQAQAYMV